MNHLKLHFCLWELKKKKKKLSSFINFVSCVFLGKSKPCHQSSFTEYELVFFPFFVFSLKALILIVETILKTIKEIYDKKMKALRRKGKAFISLEQTLFFSVYEGMINTCTHLTR